MTYPEAIQFLYRLRFFGTKLGLENTFRLAEFAGNPHERLRFIHVAGTNGKGSTCAMLESIYRCAGLRVGLFTSPHLVCFRERIQVNRELISEADVVRLLGEVRRFLEDFQEGNHPTFFEAITVMALRYFLEKRCDLVIWETGLGGRLDSTNLVTPVASVITNIQLDHEKWLGSTLDQIAAEKAGIIKPKIPVITAVEAPEAYEVIAQKAREARSPLFRLTSTQAHSAVGSIQLPLMGEHQRTNAALALTTVEVLRDQFPVSAEALRLGLQQVQWPGRFQEHRTSEGRTIILDGAHNPAGAETLRRALHEYFPGRRPTLVLGILQDKDWVRICQILAPLASRVFLAPVHSERTALPGELERVCLAVDSALEVRSFGSLSEALQAAARDPFMVVTGSLHFVGEAMELLELMPSAAGERGLNEWDASRRGLPTTVP